MKLLHVTRHAGLKMEVQAMVRHLCCIDVETFPFNDGINIDGEEAGLNFHVNPHRSQVAWNKYGAWFEKFDAVLVSDVTAMARPFLVQFRKPLFIWVFNRFDFALNDPELYVAHTDMLAHGYFPDEQYYTLMRKATTMPNVSILLSNAFEAHYALHWRHVDWSNTPILYPVGLGGRPSLFNKISTVTIEKGTLAPSVQHDQLLQAPGLYGGHTSETLPDHNLMSEMVYIHTQTYQNMHARTRMCSHKENTHTHIRTQKHKRIQIYV